MNFAPLREIRRSRQQFKIHINRERAQAVPNVMFVLFVSIRGSLRSTSSTGVAMIGNLSLECSGAGDSTTNPFSSLFS